MDRNRAIGKKIDGKDVIPWRLRRDMKHFSETTTGHAVVMGRKTYESLPESFKPLPNRTNIVLTTQDDFEAPGCFVVNFVDEALFFAEVKRSIFVIGGGEVYKLFLPLAKKLLVTEVDTEIDGCDTFFPEIGPEWTRTVLWEQEADQKNQFAFKVAEYTKN